MDLILTRTYDPELTEGVITDAQGKHICYTLELPWKDNKQGISCIPEGRYKIQKFYSQNFRETPIFKVNNVPNRSLVRIHYGNTVLDIRGCILVGEKPGVLNVKGKIYPAVLSSVKAIERLLKIVGGEGWITITSSKTEAAKCKEV